MGIARRKYASKQPPLAAVSKSSDLSSIELTPKLIRAEFMLIQADPKRLMLNNIDNITSARYTTSDSKLDLTCHLVVIFSDAPIDAFRLVKCRDGLDQIDFTDIDSRPINSPGIAALHPDLPWSSMSRFVVNTSLAISDLRPGDLLTIQAQVGSDIRPVSRIYLTGLEHA